MINDWHYFKNIKSNNSTYTSNNDEHYKPPILTLQVLLDAVEKLKDKPEYLPPLRIISSMLLTELRQTKFPKKRKNRRWVKKYKKKYTLQVPSKDVWWLKNERVLVCHETMVEKVRNAMKGLK